MEKLARRISTAIVAGAMGFVGDGVRAETFSPPVVITLTGPKAILVEVTSGTTRPCDATSNRPLYKAKMETGQVATFLSPTVCICFRQTYDNFPSANWSTSEIICKTGVICKQRRCVPDPDPVIRLTLSSADPRAQ